MKLIKANITAAVKWDICTMDYYTSVNAHYAAKRPILANRRKEEE